VYYFAILRWQVGMREQLPNITAKQTIAIHQIKDNQSQTIRGRGRLVIEKTSKLNSEMFRLFVIFIKAGRKRLLIVSKRVRAVPRLRAHLLNGADF
jgi:hypothetical protein